MVEKGIVEILTHSLDRNIEESKDLADLVGNVVKEAVRHFMRWKPANVVGIK